MSKFHRCKVSNTVWHDGNIFGRFIWLYATRHECINAESSLASLPRGFKCPCSTLEINDCNHRFVSSRIISFWLILVDNRDMMPWMDFLASPRFMEGIEEKFFEALFDIARRFKVWIQFFFEILWFVSFLWIWPVLFEYDVVIDDRECTLSRLGPTNWCNIGQCRGYCPNRNMTVDWKCYKTLLWCLLDYDSIVSVDLMIENSRERSWSERSMIALCWHIRLMVL